jgi:hypothetical protein
MSKNISYDASVELTSTITLPSTLSNTETDLFIVKDLKYVVKSQFTVYGSVALGAVASVTFYYYISPDNGVTWYPVSFFPTGYANDIQQRKCLVDSGTYTSGANSLFEDDIAVSACFAFKVTGKSASGTPTLNALRVLGRDN